MTTSGTSQRDLFDRAAYEAGSKNSVGSNIDSLPLLAIPCGFRDRSNAPCRRLADRIVMIDGEPFHHRGHRIVQCDPACFRGQGAETSRGEAADGRAGVEAGPIG